MMTPEVLVKKKKNPLWMINDYTHSLLQDAVNFYFVGHHL